MEDTERFACIIWSAGTETEIRHSCDWLFITTELVAWLYSYHPSWKRVVIMFEASEKPYLKLDNNELTYSLIDQKLVRKDFDSCVTDNYQLVCIVHFKDSDNVEAYEIDKEFLLNNFVAKLYSSYDDQWSYFETFFGDSDRPAFGDYWNSAELRRYPRITPQSLKSRLQSQHKSKWKKVKQQAFEKVYVLYFKDAPFFKVGHTYQDFERRLHGYMFPVSELTKAIAGYEIDFQKSLIITTSLQKPIGTRFCKVKIASLERKILQAFSVSKYRNVPGARSAREFLDVACFDELNVYLLSINDGLRSIQTIAEFSGFSTLNEMKEHHLSSGVSDKAVMFWKGKNFK